MYSLTAMWSIMQGRLYNAHIITNSFLQYRKYVISINHNKIVLMWCSSWPVQCRLSNVGLKTHNLVEKGVYSVDRKTNRSLFQCVPLCLFSEVLYILLSCELHFMVH